MPTMWRHREGLEKVVGDLRRVAVPGDLVGSKGSIESNAARSEAAKIMKCYQI